ncbi:MAG: TIGR03936 family radical SAM-associated protein [Candidatus Coproplasma sp.]
MIAFKYTKTDGAEYLSHLDLLRHVERTLRRAGIPLNYSEGYHAHPRIFLNNPLGVGIRSVAEYATADTPFEGDFKTLFNSRSPDGVKCLDYAIVANNQNYADCISRCEYIAQGIAPFDERLILDSESIVICDLRGREVDIRPRIYSIERQGELLKFVLGCGANNLRPDLFCSYLCSRFGGESREILKTASFADGDKFI